MVCCKKREPKGSFFYWLTGTCCVSTDGKTSYSTAVRLGSQANKQNKHGRFSARVCFAIYISGGNGGPVVLAAIGRRAHTGPSTEGAGKTARVEKTKLKRNAAKV